jgi:hypothetical protein
MFRRRKFHRLLIPVPLTVRLLGITRRSPPIDAETRNVSRRGLSIELEARFKNGSLIVQQGEETIKLIPFIVLNEKLVELDIKIPPISESIRAIGRVRWYDFGSKEKTYYFRVGIFLERMEIEDRKRWEDFIKNAKLAKEGNNS